MVVYQAVPEQAATTTGVRVVLVIEVPAGQEASASEAVRLADEFGAMISQWLPGAVSYTHLTLPTTPYV